MQRSGVNGRWRKDYFRFAQCNTPSGLRVFSVAATQSAVCIAVLYDAFGKDSAMTQDWGYAALVEINGKRILFDTGDDASVLAKNVKAKGVDLTKLEHRHSDYDRTSR